MEDFIFIEIIGFYIVMQTLNLSNAGHCPFWIVHFEGKKVVVFKQKLKILLSNNYALLQ